MARVLECYRQPEKTKCNLLRKLLCCCNKLKYQIEEKNDKKKFTLKTKKITFNFWRRLWESYSIFKPKSKIEIKEEEEEENINHTSSMTINYTVTIKIETESEETTMKHNILPKTITPPAHYDIPKFYFMFETRKPEEWDKIQNKIIEFFIKLPNCQASINDLKKITKLCGCPLYLKEYMFISCGGKKNCMINMMKFLKYWKDVWSCCGNDLSAIFIHVLAQNSKIKFVTPNNFIILVKDIINTHPSFEGIKSTPEYHSSYINTVIACIFYEINTSWNQKINEIEIRRSKLIEVLCSLEDDDAINKQLPSYFNYEQYFVIEHNFWKLDHSKCLRININDLWQYNNNAISERMLSRIFSGIVSMRAKIDGKIDIDYWNFVWFIRSEEDKSNAKSIEYWFRCMDIDGDGYLSLFELEYFYEEQLDRLNIMNMKGSLPSFKDHICEILDIVKPKYENKISLSDLKRCKMTCLFFDSFFNIDKYLKHTGLGPFKLPYEGENTNDKTNWELFVEKQFDYLINKFNV